VSPTKGVQRGPPIVNALDGLAGKIVISNVLASSHAPLLEIMKEILGKQLGL
jgi:hypothetical protein